MLNVLDGKARKILHGRFSFQEFVRYLRAAQKSFLKNDVRLKVLTLNLVISGYHYLLSGQLE